MSTEGNTPPTPAPVVTPAPTPAPAGVPATFKYNGKEYTTEQVQEAFASRETVTAAAERLLDGDGDAQRTEAATILKARGYSQAEIDAKLSRVFGDNTPEPEAEPTGGDDASIETLRKKVAELEAQQLEVQRLHTVRASERIEQVVESSLNESIQDAQNGLGQVQQLLKASKQTEDEVSKAMAGFAERVKKDAVASLMQIKQKEGVVTEAAIRREMKAAASALAATLKPLLGSIKTLGASPSSGVWEQVLKRPEREAPKTFTPGRDDVGKTQADFEAWAASLIAKDTARTMISRETNRA